MKWNNISVDTLCCNTVGTEPMGRVKGKGEVSKTQPSVVKQYNQGVGRGELMDKHSLILDKKFLYEMV